MDLGMLASTARYPVSKPLLVCGFAFCKGQAVLGHLDKGVVGSRDEVAGRQHLHLEYWLDSMVYVVVVNVAVDLLLHDLMFGWTVSFVSDSYKGFIS